MREAGPTDRHTDGRTGGQVVVPILIFLAVSHGYSIACCFWGFFLLFYFCHYFHLLTCGPLGSNFVCFDHHFYALFANVCRKKSLRLYEDYMHTVGLESTKNHFSRHADHLPQPPGALACNTVIRVTGYTTQPSYCTDIYVHTWYRYSVRSTVGGDECRKAYFR